MKTNWTSQIENLYRIRGYGAWDKPSFEEGFDFVVEAVQTAVRNMELEKYEVASGYQIVQKVRLNNRSTSHLANPRLSGSCLTNAYALR